MPRHAIRLAASSAALVFLVFLVTLPVAASEAPGFPPYAWSLSGSSTDPTVNTGFATFGVQTLYLWNLTSAAFGWDQTCFDLVATGIVILAINPGLGVAIVDDCFYAACPTGDSIVATVTILDQPGEICFGPSVTTGENCSRDCGPGPSWWANSWTGYSNTGSTPCSFQSGLPCDTVGAEEVEPGSWGRIKTQYR